MNEFGKYVVLNENVVCFTDTPEEQAIDAEVSLIIKTLHEQAQKIVEECHQK